MAVIQAEIKTPAARTVTVHLYFPTDLPASIGNKVRGVITLLHGFGNSGMDWIAWSAAARYAADNGYILICPDAENSFYTNMVYGPPWFDILTEYLPHQLQTIFQIPTQREMNYIAGLSMGGYGAMRIGLACPERYAAIGSFSGALDMPIVAQNTNANGMAPWLVPAFGETMQLPPEGNLFHLADKVAALPKPQQPRLYACCGLQDNDETQMLAQSDSFARYVGKLPLDFTYRKWDGNHEWKFWDRALAEFIGFIQNSNYAAKKRADWSSPVQPG